MCSLYLPDERRDRIAIHSKPPRRCGPWQNEAKLTFTDYNQAARDAVSTFDQWIEASQVGAQGITKKAMKFAHHNVLSAFDFAQKIVQAKDIDELKRTQTEFVQWQIQVLSEQVKDLGEIVESAI
jgi:hypothetical protein